LTVTSRSTKKGSLKEATFRSKALGVEKKYFIYLPPKYNGTTRFPVVYLFRGHEKEWIDKEQDTTRNTNAVEIADDLISQKEISDMILVMPSTTSDDGSVITCGLNLRSPNLVTEKPGVGTGHYADYLLELIRHIDDTYRTKTGRYGRAVDGFSVGGHTALLLALKNPEMFCSVGAYDGSFGFLRKRDPRKSARPLSDALFDPFAYMYGQPFDQKHFRQNNPADLILTAGSSMLKALRGLRFHICSAGAPEPRSNRDRTLHIMSLLALRGVENEPESAILDPNSEHTWYWADEHLKRSLLGHHLAFERSSVRDHF
jgi:S-formylglutathione hydrolase FrmB